MSVTLIIGSAKPETTKLAQYMDQLCHSMSKNSDSVTTKVRAGRNRELVTVNWKTPRGKRELLHAYVFYGLQKMWICYGGLSLACASVDEFESRIDAMVKHYTGV